MRPTGQLHVGHLLGALGNWVRMQDDYECIYMVADLHALTTGYEDVQGIRANGTEMVADWVAAGVDPERSIIFRQSDVPQHAELAILLGMITPLSWLERVPTYKGQIDELGEHLLTYGFLGYPLLQTADVILYKAGAVGCIVRRYTTYVRAPVVRQAQGLNKVADLVHVARPSGLFEAHDLHAEVAPGHLALGNKDGDDLFGAIDGDGESKRAGPW